METTMLFSRIAGLLFLIMGVAMMMDKNMYKTWVADFKSNMGVSWTYAMMAFVIGMLMIHKHNVWEWSHVGFITFLGWAAVVKASVYMLWPKALLNWSAKQAEKKSWNSFVVLVMLLLGAWLTYQGFWA
jgi:hypothetical protein